MSWLPILQGSYSERAEARLDHIQEDLRRYADVPRFPNRVLNAEDTERTLASLSWGLPGRALFFAYAALRANSQALLNVAIESLATSTNSMAKFVFPPHLFAGYLGIGWVARHVARLIDPTHVSAADSVESELAVSLAHYEDGSVYELTRGIVGAGVFILERDPLSPLGETLISTILDRLEAWAEWCGNMVVWRRTPEQLANDGAPFFEAGAYDLGIAHGVSGILVFLALCAEADLERNRTARMAHALGRWILAHRMPPGSPSVFPEAVAMSGEKYPSRLAWCYGDLAVVTALLRAANACGLDELRGGAMDALAEAGRRQPAQSGVADGGLCHGAAGVAHMFRRLYYATGDERTGDAALRWYQFLLDMPYDESGLGGFATSWSEDGKHYAIRDPGLITGAAGIGLTLMSAVGNIEPAWDRLLLLDLRRVS
jgi:lantibiotic modifying enzyme